MLIDRASRSGTDTRRAIPLTFTIGVLLLVGWWIRHAVLLIYISAVFAVVLEPAVAWLHTKSLFGWHPGRGSALLLLVLILCLFLGGMFAIAVPSVIDNVRGFIGTLTSQAGALQAKLRSVPLLRNLDLSRLQPSASSAVATLLPAVRGTLTDVLSTILLIAYFILDGRSLLKRGIALFPTQMRPRLEGTLHRAGERMRHWLTGQAILMAILGGSAAVTFGIMGLPYFYLLALFAGIANIVPLLGPLATVVLAGLVAATQSGWKVLGW
jgi:predicted PurR-regulated permease PerM